MLARCEVSAVTVCRASALEDVVSAVADLDEVGDARLLVHDRRAAHEADRVRARREEGLRDHRVADVADVVLPLAGVALGDPVHRVPDLEAGGEPLDEVVDEVLRQDVVRRLVGEEHLHLGRVVRVGEDAVRRLVRQGDARAPSDQGHLRALPRLVHPGEVALALVLELAERPLHLDRVADLHAVQVLRHLAALGEPGVHVLEVDLDDQVHVAAGEIVGDGRVRPHDHLALVPGLQEHVLARGQAEHHVLTGQSEAEDASVVVDDNLLDKRDLLELFGLEEGDLNRDTNIYIYIYIYIYMDAQIRGCAVWSKRAK